MAEFQEVCRQALRMGKVINAEEGFPVTHVGLFITFNGEVIDKRGMKAVTPDVLERSIMEWAAKHPEMVYPSWNDAWKELFPVMAERNAPCPRYFMPNEIAARYCTHNCGECHKRPIPADIAEKLGIKPKLRKEQADD